MANNRLLRSRLERAAQAKRIPFLPALPQHTGDNAGMIAFAAWAEAAATAEAAGGMGLRIEPSLELAGGVR